MYAKNDSCVYNIQHQPMFAFITHNSIVQDLSVVKKSINNIETRRQMKMLVNQLNKYSTNKDIIITADKHTQTQQMQIVNMCDKSNQTTKHETEDKQSQTFQIIDDEFEYLE